jgi:hypothetical protein
MHIGIILLAGTVAAALLILIGWALGRYSRAPKCNGGGVVLPRCRTQ